MNKTLVRVLAFVLVLGMLPTAFISALASGYGVANNTTENQTLDYANGQFIPETITIDGEFDDTGWPIEGWTYVTSANGNWNVETPDEANSQMMYQYQLRADYKYFYVGAVVVLPEGAESGDFFVYLSDTKNGNGYEITTAAFQFNMTGDVITASAIDCAADDGLDVDISSDSLCNAKRVDTNKYYIEFRNNIANTYNDANEIRYFVSANVKNEDGTENGLYHPIYYTRDGTHGVPTFEFWPGGGAELSCMDESKDRYEGVVKVDGKFDEDIWQNGTAATGFSAYAFNGSTGWISVAPGDGKSRWQNKKNTFEDYHYEYKMAVNNNTLYLAVVINTRFIPGNVDTGTNVRLWFKTNSSATVYSYFYDINGTDCKAIKNTSTSENKQQVITSTTQRAAKMQAFGEQTVVEFSVPLSEFGGASGFAYYIGVSTVDVNTKGAVAYGTLYNGNYSDAPWETWDTNNDTDVTVSQITTSGAITVNGDFSDAGWNGITCDVLQNVNTIIKYDNDYLYGKVSAQFKSGKSVADVDAIRLWTAGGSQPYVVNLLDGNICTDIPFEHACGTADVAHTTTGNDIVFEFKAPLRALGFDNGVSDLGYYISAEKGNGATVYTNATASASGVNVFAKNTYNDGATAANAMGNTVTIDGNFEEEAWNVDFHKANFGNSIVMQQPKYGGSYDYSYMILAGSNYIYGAVVLDDIANDETTFTLWLDNGIDEYEWIGDNDSNTPHISYRIYKDTDADAFGTRGVGDNLLGYYVNYKYEFNLKAKTATPTPNYYFNSDSNLEKDKVYIEKGKNYDYAVTSINGKTYLEFKIDVKNFHWLDASKDIEYITSMTHQVNVNGTQDITVYNPQFNDRTNFWITNSNSVDVYRYESGGYLYSTFEDFKLPPSRWWYGIKLKPVENTDTNTKYEIVDLVNGNMIDKKPAELFIYTEEEANAGYLYYLQCAPKDASLKGTKAYGGMLTHPSVRYIDLYEKDGIDGNFSNRSIVDLRNIRANKSQEVVFSWKEGDIVELGYQDTALTRSELASHKDLAGNDDLKLFDTAIHFNRSKTLIQTYGTLLTTNTTDTATKTPYYYVDPTECGTSADSNTAKDVNVTLLTDGVKNTLRNDTFVYLRANADSNEKDRSSVVIDLGKAKTSNNYTAYLTSGLWGIDANGVNMEVYGSNNNVTWDRIAGASYNQLYLHKGDGYSLSNDDIAAANKGTITFSGGGKMVAGPGSGILMNDDVLGSHPADIKNNTTIYHNHYDGTGVDDTYWNSADSDALIVQSSTAKSSDAKSTFYMDIEFPAFRTINQIDLTYFVAVNRVIGVPCQQVVFYTSVDGKNWDKQLTTNQTFLNSNRQEVGTTAAAWDNYTDSNGYEYVYDDDNEKSKIYDMTTDATGLKHDVNIKHYYSKLVDARINLDTTYTSRFFRVEFEYPNYPGDKAYGKNDMYVGTDMYRWEFVGFTEIDFAHSSDGLASTASKRGQRVPTENDTFSLTAIAEEPVSYRYLKYTFIESDKSEANGIAVEELEAHYSAEIAALPKQTVLHLNTNQMGSPMLAIDSTKDKYLGRFNTYGTPCKNNGSSMNTPCADNTEHSNQVFAETIVTPGYNHNANFDVSFYSEFYMERVQTAPVDQPDEPVEDNSNPDWDGRNANVVKKLKHIAPDVIEVDGNLNDSGWDGTWTDVDGAINATNLSGDGVKFKYQLRANGEYLYVAAVIKAAESANPALKLWLKGNDADATTFTNLYSVGAGATTNLAIGEQNHTTNGVVDGAYVVYQYGDTEINGSIELAGNIVAKKNDSTTPAGMEKATTLDYAKSAIFGYTKEVVESTHDGIWVWDANPITQGYRVALEHACINSAADRIVGNATGSANDTIVEFRVKLDEFGGKNGFEYFISATADSGETIYPHVYAKDGDSEYHLPEWNWDSVNAVKVTAEDMTGWGIYRMVNDYAPMTSLGARINDNYNNTNNKAIRFGARYTEEFIRRQANVVGIDYWDVADAGIVFVPTHVIPDKDPYSLNVDVSSAKVVSAKDIVNWKNESPDGATNFADYESFVFFVNLVGVPDTAVEMPFAFRGYVDYYEVSGCNTYYGIPLERSYSLVESTVNEGVIRDTNNAELYTPTVSLEYSGTTQNYYGENESEAVKVLYDGIVREYDGGYDYKRHTYSKGSFSAFLVENSDPTNNVGCTFSTILTYEQAVTFDAIDLGLYMVPDYKIAPPKSVTVYVMENDTWVKKDENVGVYVYDSDTLDAIGNNELSTGITIPLKDKYVGQQIKLEFTFPDFVFKEDMTTEDGINEWKEFKFVGLTEVGLSLK